MAVRLPAQLQLPSPIAQTGVIECYQAEISLAIAGRISKGATIPPAPPRTGGIFDYWFATRTAITHGSSAIPTLSVMTRRRK
jgi:hypothetical protein